MKSSSSTTWAASKPARADRVSSGQRLNVTVLSHSKEQAQAFIHALQASLESHAGADATALIWQAGSQAQAAIGSDLCLLMPWDADGSQGADLLALQAHRELRLGLHQHGLTFEVLRGQAPRLLKQALSALSRWQPALRPEGAQTLGRPGWSSSCERCGDPDCEFRLFKGAGGSSTG